MSITYPVTPIDYVEGPSNPYTVSSVAIIQNNYLNLLKINVPGWNGAPYTFNYFKINYDYFISIISKFYNSLVINNDNSLSDLTKINPIATRFISSNGSFLVERPPFKATMRFTPTKAAYASASNNIHEVEAWIPWQVYIAYFNPLSSKFSLRIFFNHKPITSLEDEVIPAWTPNLFGDSGVCFGEDSMKVLQEISSSNISNKTIFENMCSSYWSGGWNTDIIPSSYLVPPFLNQEFETNDDYDFAIHREIVSKSVYSKHKNSFTRSYINVLNLWSNYNLDNLLHMISKYPPKSKFSLNSLFKIEEENSNYAQVLAGDISSRPAALLLDLFARSHKFPLSIFTDNSKYFYSNFENIPYDNSVVRYEENITQEKAYDILHNLVTYYQNNAPTETSISSLNSFFTDEEPF